MAAASCVYDGSVRGFAASMSATAASRDLAQPPCPLRRAGRRHDDRRQPAERDVGLDRIDQRNLPLNTTYTYDTNAVNVDVYIIDTGIEGRTWSSAAA